MGGVQDLVERIKYADAALKKKVVLGLVAGVLFLVAGVLLIRGLMGPGVERVDTQTETAVAELREDLAGDQPPPEVEEDMPAFQRGGQEAPPQ